MDALVRLWEHPVTRELYMLAGWQQWADAGSISSGLPQYLVKKLEARKIGEIVADNFYLFQVPGAHHFLRPQVKLEEGYRATMSVPQNEIFYTGNQEKGLLLFLGEEPHMNIDRYVAAFLDVVRTLNVKRIVILGGVYGAMPYDKDREVSCVYSLPHMKSELAKYAVRFSDYEGGATIGAYLAHKAEAHGIEVVVFYGFVPSYDFSELSAPVHGLRIENDFKAWYDLMRRVNYMFNMEIDLTELEQEGKKLLISMEAELEELGSQVSDVDVQDYLEKLFEDFQERRFIPLGDMWERGLRDLFKDLDENSSLENEA